MRQLALNLSICASCRAGRRHDATHDRGCGNRWLTVGQSFDELQGDEQLAHFELMRRHRVTKATTIEDYSAGLYRPRRAETIAPDSGNCRARSNETRVRTP